MYVVQGTTDNNCKSSLTDLMVGARPNLLRQAQNIGPSAPSSITMSLCDKDLAELSGEPSLQAIVLLSNSLELVRELLLVFVRFCVFFYESCGSVVRGCCHIYPHVCNYFVNTRLAVSTLPPLQVNLVELSTIMPPILHSLSCHFAGEAD